MTIYTIYKATNLINGKVYIGFDSYWSQRKSGHKTDAFKNNKSSIFHRAIRKYGWDNFSWEIIYQSKDYYHTLNTMENYFIEEYRSYIGFEDCNGYNMTLGGEGGQGNNAITIEVYDPEGNCCKIHNVYKFCLENNLTPECFYGLHKGKIKYYKGYKSIHDKNYVSKFEKEYVFIGLDGEIITVNNLSDFCENKDLLASSLCDLINGKMKYYKGYRNINFPNHVPQTKRIYEFTDPNGKIIKITNMYQFCKDNNLNRMHMTNVFMGRLVSYKGYRNINYKKKTPTRKKLNNKIIKLYDPNGVIIEFDDVTSFCKERGIDRRRIYDLINRKKKSYKGYKLFSVENVITEPLYKFIKSDIIYDVYNVSEFCKNNNLLPSALYDLINGIRKIYKGFKIFNNEENI